MPTLWSATWKFLKSDIKVLQINFNAAVSDNKEEIALQYFEQTKELFETKTYLSIATFFEKMKVKSYQKKVIGKMEKQLIKKGWLNS